MIKQISGFPFELHILKGNVCEGRRRAVRNSLSSDVLLSFRQRYAIFLLYTGRSVIAFYLGRWIIVFYSYTGSKSVTVFYTERRITVFYTDKCVISGDTIQAMPPSLRGHVCQLLWQRQLLPLMVGVRQSPAAASQSCTLAWQLSCWDYRFSHSSTDIVSPLWRSFRVVTVCATRDWHDSGVLSSTGSFFTSVSDVAVVILVYFRLSLRHFHQQSRQFGDIAARVVKVSVCHKRVAIGSCFLPPCLVSGTCLVLWNSHRQLC